MKGRRSRWVLSGVALLVLAVLVLLVGVALRARDLQTAANVAQLVSIPLAVAPLFAGLVAWARQPSQAEQDPSSAPSREAQPAERSASASPISSTVGAQLSGVSAGGNITVNVGGVYPTTAHPAGPGGSGWVAPAAGRRLWSVPPRRPGFVGRAELLEELESKLHAEGRVVVAAAVTGMGGIGKTTAAIEYVHRHAAELDVAWWVPSEDLALVPDRLAELALLLELTGPAEAPAMAVARLHAELASRDRWLVVFDNAEDPRVLEPLIPQGPGRVIITSRNPGWRAHAVTLELDGFTRAESVALLKRRVPGLGGAEADRVAAAVGDLPLAVDQAAGLLADTTLTVEQYLDEVSRRAVSVLAQQQAGPYPVSVAALFCLAFDQLSTDHPEALELLTLMAWLGPDPVPQNLLIEHSDQFPNAGPGGSVDAMSLRSVAADPLALASSTSGLHRRALAVVTPDALQLHRVPATLLRDRTRYHREPSWAAVAGGLLRAALPEDVWNNPPVWPVWARLLSHVLAVTDPARAARPSPADESWLLDRSGVYLQSRGELAAARPLIEQAYALRCKHFSNDHPETLDSANNLARILRALGQYQRSRDLDIDTLDRRRRLLGYDNPSTLVSASYLALDLRALGDYQEARQLGADTLARRRRVLGDDHADTLVSANNLAIDLSALGENREAHDLHQDTFVRRRRTLGRDHPNTLASMNNLALALRSLGDHHQAWALHEDTLTRRRQVLGDDHPSTLSTIHSLGTDAYTLGDYRRARIYHEDAFMRRRIVLGDDHPETLASARGLTADLHALRENRVVPVREDATRHDSAASGGSQEVEPGYDKKAAYLDFDNDDNRY